LKAILVRQITIALLFLSMVFVSGGFAKDVSFTLEDRDRLIRLEVSLKEFKESVDSRFEMMDKMIDERFESMDKSIDKRFDSIDKRFESMDAKIDLLAAIFTTLVVSVIGFAIWDRRTMIRPFETKVKAIEGEIGEMRGQQQGLIEALQILGRQDKQVAEVLKRFHLM